MGRLTASFVRGIADDVVNAEKEAKRQELLDAVLKKKKSIQDQKRRMELWKKLYLTAINGNDFYDAINIDFSDINYFSKLGFAVSDIYTRKEDFKNLNNRRNQIIGLLDKKHERIFDLDDQILNYESNPDGLDLELLEKWVSKNSFHAFACGMEKWFDLDRPYSSELVISDLYEIEKLTIENLNKSKLPDRIEVLNSLLAIVRKIINSRKSIYKIDEMTERLQTLKAEVERLTLELDQIDFNKDYQNDRKIKSITRFGWSDIIISGGVCDFAGYSYQSLRWFCSKLAQEGFENFEEDVKSLASKGHREMVLRIKKYINSFCVINDKGCFESNFPSWFDFRESFSLLGYSVSDRDDSWYVKINW
jgi:uncharacterized small protein (DUF1192 family)